MIVTGLSGIGLDFFQQERNSATMPMTEIMATHDLGSWLCLSYLLRESRKWNQWLSDVVTTQDVA